MSNKKRPQSQSLVSLPLKNKSKGKALPAVSDPLMTRYMQEVSQYPLLSREEEYELAVEFYEKKDKTAFQKLVTSNLRFVVKIAHEYAQYRMKLIDLIQEGNTGLLKAVSEFNPYKNVRLTTYAVWWIKSYIQDALMKNHHLVRIGKTQAQKKLFYRLNKEREKLEKEGIVGQCQVKQIAANLDVKESEVIDMTQRMSQVEVDMNQMGDVFVGEGKGVDDELSEKQKKAMFIKGLQEFHQTLEGRDKDFFEKRVVSESPMTLEAIGKKYKVSKERARQIEVKIKKSLKVFLEEKYPSFKEMV